MIKNNDLFFVSSNLKELRTRNKYTQSQLADKAHISLGTYKNYENGKSFPNLNNLNQIAEANETDLTEILKGTTFSSKNQFNKESSVGKESELFIEIILKQLEIKDSQISSQVETITILTQLLKQKFSIHI